MYYLIFVIGACIGSFLNVCIYRIPRGQSIIWPGSRCPMCESPIRWFDNIPILGWFMLKGKCRNCKNPISFRYPLVEFITAVLFVASWHFLPTFQAIIASIFVSILIVVTLIDLDFLMIPDRLTLGGFVFAIIASFCLPFIHGEISSSFFLVNSLRSGIAALSGAFIGSGLLIWIAFLSEAILKEESIGFGDIKLMGFIGALCGWKGAVFTIFGGAALATLFLFPLVFMRKLKSRDLESSYTVIPFGPWLALAAILYFIFLRAPIDDYFYEISSIFYRS